MKSKCCFASDLKRLEFKCLRLFTIKRRLVKNRKSKTLLHFLLLRLRGIHQFSKLINRLKRLCVYFYYGANKSCSRAMWGSRQSDAISFFLLQAMCSISGLFHDEVESCLHYLYQWHESMQATSQCLKITQNVSFEFVNFGTFQPILSY